MNERIALPIYGESHRDRRRTDSYYDPGFGDLILGILADGPLTDDNPDGSFHWEVAELINDYRHTRGLTLQDALDLIDPEEDPDEHEQLLELEDLWLERHNCHGHECHRPKATRAAAPLARRACAEMQRIPNVQAVYVIAANGLLKIGVASSLRDRYRGLTTMNASDLALVGFIRGATQFKERELHRRFAMHRHHGEWFKDAPEIRAIVMCEPGWSSIGEAQP